MQSLPRLAHRSCGRALLGLSAFLFASVALAPQASFGATPRQSELWQRAIDDVSKGEFQHAAETLRKVRSDDELVTQVRTWLEEFEAKQTARREFDQADFDKYVGYAKARVERKEHSRALGWALWALNTTTNRDEFLASPWLLELVNASLAKTDELRQEDDWRGVWGLYSQLASLYEREPTYEKLERQALTHLRLESMFGKKSKWKERIEKVIWRDAERALKEIDRAYVEPADFRKIAESGLEQMLLLADSKTAREHEDCKGLADEDSRRHFKLRVQARLDQVRAATKIDHKDCVGYFRRGIQINKETVALPEELVVSELMRGALDVLDDYTTIIWPSASDEFDKHTKGDFVGVGISISKNRADEIEVITPMDGGPAYAAGIQAGDVITDVDGMSIKDFSINKVVKTITGETGTPVTLTIRRGEESLDFDLIRRRVHIVSVKGHRRNSVDEERWDYWLDRERGIGYIRLTNFARNTFEDLQNALSELPHLQGLILDLRGNPGGLLDSAWNVASLFLERGDVVVSTKGRISDDDKTFPANSTGSYAGFPLIVLVDNRSASASEIVSGAIRDNGRGTVVGERTFGKFSVQNLVQLNRRSGAKLKITTARYYLPNGDSLHRTPTSETWGVTPAIAVPLVNKERRKILQMQRKANLLGPPKATPTTVDADANDEDDSGEETVDQSGQKKPADKEAQEVPAEAGDADAHAVDDKDQEDELPPLKQPDENNRPEADPQLDTALLVLRVALLGEQFPTLTVAEVPTKKDTAKP